MSISTLTAADFEPHISEDFTVGAAGKQTSFRLAGVEHLGAAVRDGGAFSLLFRSAPTAPILPQGVYPVQHPALGTLELFIVPLGPQDGGNSYQVIFT